MNEKIIICPFCNTKLIEYEFGNSIGIGNLTEEDAICINCGNIVDTRLSQNALATRYYSVKEND